MQGRGVLWECELGDWVVVVGAKRGEVLVFKDSPL